MMELRNQVNDFFGVIQTFSSETDRGVALVCAAFLESELKGMLEACFIDEPSVVDKLFTANGPLSTLSSRIDVAYSMGLIGKDFRLGLHLIRRIRNEFAHFHEPQSFKDEKIAARCRELTKLISGATGLEDSREIFTLVCNTAVAKICSRTLRSRHAKQPNDHHTDEYLTGRKAEFRIAFKEIVDNLPEERLKRLHDPATSLEEFKEVFIDALIKDQQFDESSPDYKKNFLR